MNLLAFIVVLGVMIIVHELGHFWAALAVGVRVEAFSVGFGPRLFGFRRGNTDFRVSAIPLGGYVRMLGEQPGDDNAVQPDSFQAKARWQRAIVVFAGPLMNILLAIALVTGLFMHQFAREIDPKNPVIVAVTANSAASTAGLQAGDQIVEFDGEKNPDADFLGRKELLNSNHTMPLVVVRQGQRLNLSVTPRMDKEGVGQIGWSVGEVFVNAVQPKSPAQAAGLKVGDLLLTANGKALTSSATLPQIVGQSGGKAVALEVARDSTMLKFDVTPRANPDGKPAYLIGVSVGRLMQVVKLNLAEAFVESLRYTRRNATFLFQILAGIVQQRVSPKTVAGPIGMFEESGQAARLGFFPFLNFLAFVSLNLAIFNLLPIPILDGGTLLLLAVEMLLQREVSTRFKENAFKLGFVFLMMVVVFVFYNDISKRF